MADYKPPAINIRIKNLPQIRAAFGASPRLMARELKNAFIYIGNEVRARSMADTPVDTGRLQRSHYTKYNPYSAVGYYLEIGTGIPKDRKAYYDVYVHEGTKYMTGRPYLKEAVEQKEDLINTRLTKAVDNVLNAIGRAT